MAPKKGKVAKLGESSDAAAAAGAEESAARAGQLQAPAEPVEVRVLADSRQNGGLTTTKATVTIEVEGGTGWPAELLKDAERQLRFTQSVGPAGLDLYFYDPEADTLDLRTASRKLPKLSPGCFFYVVRRDMQPAHEDGDSNADPELVKLMKRGKAQHAAAAPAPQTVQAATSSDSAQLKEAATGANYLKEDTDGKRGTGDCNTARDVVRLLWDEPIEGSGGSTLRRHAREPGCFSRLRPLLTPFDKEDLSHLQSLTRCKTDVYFHNIENILCILRMRKAEQEVPDDHYKLKGISRPGILDVADFILGSHNLTVMEENVAGWMDGKDAVDRGERRGEEEVQEEAGNRTSRLVRRAGKENARAEGQGTRQRRPTDEESDEEDDVEDKLEDDDESGNEDEDEGEDEDEDAEAASPRKRNRKAETKGQEAKHAKQEAGKRKKQEKEMGKEAKKPKAAAMTEKQEMGQAGPQQEKGRAGPNQETGRAGPERGTGRAGPQQETGRAGRSAGRAGRAAAGDGAGGPQQETGRAGPQQETGRAGPQQETGRAGPQQETGRVGPQQETGRVGPQQETGRAGPERGLRLLGLHVLRLLGLHAERHPPPLS
eukprot:tig00022080_g23796.t1